MKTVRDATSLDPVGRPLGNNRALVSAYGAWHRGRGLGGGEASPGQPVGAGRSLLTLSDFEAFAALFAVAVERVEDDRVRFRGGSNLVDFDGFAFELFVILKEAAEHEEAVGR